MKNTIMFKEIESQSSKIFQCYQRNKDLLPEIIKSILEFKPYHILLTGRGTSLNSCLFAKALFEMYCGIPVSIASPSLFTIYNKNLNLEKSLVIAVSQSGAGKDIYTVVKKANESGALTLSITNEKSSLISSESKLNLYNFVDTAISYSATKTFTSSLYLFLKLITSLSPTATLKVDENKLCAVLQSSLKYQNNIETVCKQFLVTKQIIIISRGYSMCLAEELSLKLKESCHIQADAFSSSDFYHGPIVMSNKTIPVILFALDKFSNKNILDLSKLLKANNIPLFSITNSEEILTETGNGILIHEENELYDFFAGITVLQLFANSLSVLKGLNPDYVEILEVIDTL